MPLHVRAFEKTDYEAAARFAALMFPEFPVNEEAVRNEHATMDAVTKVHRFILEEWGLEIGYGAWFSDVWSDGQGRVRLRVQMEPTQGVFAEALRWIEADASESGAKEALIRNRSDHSLMRKEIVGAGYEAVEDETFCVLSTDRFDDAAWSTRLATIAEEGIRIVDFEQLRDEGYDWLRPLYEATNEMSEDIPTALGYAPQSFDDFVTYMTDELIMDHRLMFAAMDGGRIVSYTRLERSQSDPACSMTGFSGTVRSHRRRGLVTAVKAACTMAARKYGVKQILTDNHDANPMLQVNLRLGFEPAFTATLYRKVFW